MGKKLETTFLNISSGLRLLVAITQQLPDYFGFKTQENGESNGKQRRMT